jgi:hypothetical protein
VCGAAQLTGSSSKYLGFSCRDLSWLTRHAHDDACTDAYDCVLERSV